MKINKQDLREIFAFCERDEVKSALTDIENKIEEDIHTINTDHWLDYATFHQGSKRFKDLNQKRYKKGGIYFSQVESTLLADLSYLELDLDLYKKQNIPLSIFELRALLRRLQIKHGYEVAFIHGMELIGIGEFVKESELFQKALFVEQMRMIRDEIFVVLLVKVGGTPKKNQRPIPHQSQY